MIGEWGITDADLEKEEERYGGVPGIIIIIIIIIILIKKVIITYYYNNNNYCCDKDYVINRLDGAVHEYSKVLLL